MPRTYFDNCCRKTAADMAVRLGDSVMQLMELSVQPRYAKLAPVLEEWADLLPPELAGNCRIVDLMNGELTVAAASSAYAYELRLCSADLVDRMQQRCPHAKVRTIKVVVDG